jgi:anti-sigma factor RsiW
MSCPSFEERIALYTGGDLEPAEIPAVLDHLRGCPACAALAGAFERDRQRFAAVPPEMADIDFAAMRRETIQRARSRRRLLPVLLAAASLLLAAGAAIEWRAFHRPVPPLPMAHAVMPPAPVVLGGAGGPQRGTPPDAARVPRSGSPSGPGELRSARPTRPRSSEPSTLAYVPPGAIRVPTRDPSVVIIWFSETKGDSRE